MIGDFFIWCAGTDKGMLSKSPDNERTKHIGYGTMVLIPAILAFVSMSYALSTIDIIKENTKIIFFGGFIWSFIIFSFDRFIVSTHRKKKKNIDELKNPTFFLRLFFAIVLGIAVSHPFVLLWFDGSISQEIITDRNDRIDNINNDFQSTVSVLNIEIDSLNSRKQCLQQLLIAEQNGRKIDLPCGSSSGLPTYGKRAIVLNNMITGVDSDITLIRTRINNNTNQLETVRDNRINDIKEHTSFDYLKRELTLQKIIKDNQIVGITQFFIILLFILVDLLPLIFKTFAPFGIYDKTLSDDINILISDNDIDTSSRKTILQQAYNEISNVYAEKKHINKTPEQIKALLMKAFTEKKMQRNVFIGLFFGFLTLISFIIYKDIIVDPTETNENLPKLFSFSSFLLAVITSILGAYLYDIVKLKPIKS